MNRSAIFFLWRHYNYILVFLLIKTNISLGTLPGALRFSSDKNSSWIFLISALRPLFLLSLFALHPSFITLTQGTGTHAHTHTVQKGIDYNGTTKERAGRVWIWGKQENVPPPNNTLGESKKQLKEA